MSSEPTTSVSPGRALAWLARTMELALAELDMSLSQYRLLGLLDDAEEYASALADKLTVSRPSITTLVDGLVARGYVERSTVAGDRRKVTHAVTDAGRAQLRLADDAINRMIDPVLDQLSARDAQHAHRAFTALGEKLAEQLSSLRESS